MAESNKGKLTILWCNVYPPQLPDSTQQNKPCIIADNQISPPAVTIWDWDTPFAERDFRGQLAAIGIVVKALGLLKLKSRRQLNKLDPSPSYEQLVEWLGENAFKSEDYDKFDALALASKIVNDEADKIAADEEGFFIQD